MSAFAARRPGAARLVRTRGARARALALRARRRSSRSRPSRLSSTAELLIHPPAGAAAGDRARSRRRAARRWRCAAATAVRRCPPWPGRSCCSRRSSSRVLALGVPAHLLAARPPGAGSSGTSATASTASEPGCGPTAGARSGRGWPCCSSSRSCWSLAGGSVLLARGARARGCRRAVALALLVGLFLIGAANTPQPEPGLRGLVLLDADRSLAVGARLRPGRRGAGRALADPAGAARARPAPRRSAPRAPGCRFREPAGAVAAEARFQWDQVYGPITWPRTEATMLTHRRRRTRGCCGHLARPLRRTAVPALGRRSRHRAARRSAAARTGTGGSPARRSRSPDCARGCWSAATGCCSNCDWLSAPGSPVVTRSRRHALLAGRAERPGSTPFAPTAPARRRRELRRAPRRFPRAYLPYTRFELPRHARPRG